MSPNFGVRPMVGFILEPQARDLSEMRIVGDQGRVCLQAMSGDPDVVNRYRGSVFPAFFACLRRFHSSPPLSPQFDFCWRSDFSFPTAG